MVVLNDDDDDDDAPNARRRLLVLLALEAFVLEDSWLPLGGGSLKSKSSSSMLERDL